jgi:hypothetical protein
MASADPFIDSRSHAIDWLRVVCRQAPCRSLVYFYCQYLDKCTTGDVLHTFLRQLLKDHFPNVYPAIQPLYEEQKHHQVPLEDSEAISILGLIIQYFQKTFIVVDGLNEMLDIEKATILNHLKTLQINLLIFSRRMDAFMGFLPIMTSFSIEARNGDIEAFVHDRISNNYCLHRLLQHDDTATQEVVTRIQQNLCRM